MTTNAFRAAVEAGDLEAIPAMLAEDVTFISPVAFKPYQGRELVAAILGGAFRVLEGLHYVREIGGEGDADHALVFKAVVNGLETQGCDFLRYDEQGLISEFMVMVRPLSAAQAVAERMAQEFAAIQTKLAG